MQTWLTIFSLSFLTNGLFFSAVRTIKFRRMRALRYLNLRDLNFITLSSAVMATVSVLSLGYLKILLALLIMPLVFLLTIDAVVAMEYGYQLDWQTLKLVWQQRKALGGGGAGNQGFIKQIVKDYWHFFLLPVAFIFYFFGLVLNSSIILWYFFPIYFSIVTFILTKSKLNAKTYFPWVLFLAIVYFIQYYFTQSGSLEKLSLSWLVIIFICTLVFANILRRFTSIAFFQIPSVIGALLTTTLIKRQVGFIPKAEDAEIIDLHIAEPACSALHGKLKNTNVILVYLESVSSLAHWNKELQRSNLPYFDKLAKQGWVSDYHVCITPNTNSSLMALFSSQYALTSNYHFVNLLKQQNYQTIFMAATHLEGGTKELAQTIGFDDIIYNVDHIDYRGDADFYQQKLVELKASLQKKSNYFLVVHNKQTHIPYEVVNEKPEKNSYQRFQQAMLEADKAIEGLIAEITNPEDDTLIIYTSDHGQSFGQFGFRAHSNAVIKEQMNVPLAFSHPKLHPYTITHSSHFDVMPTIMDLLGIAYPYPIEGRSLAQENLPFSHILFSETRRGNLPSCFAHINKERKLFFDLNYYRFLWLTLDDKIIATLTPKEKDYYSQVMLRALQERQLVNRPYSQ